LRKLIGRCKIVSNLKCIKNLAALEDQSLGDLLEISYKTKIV
jgi:hypothetical protein